MDLLAEVVVDFVTDLVVMGVVDFFCEEDDRNRGRASDRTGVARLSLVPLTTGLYSQSVVNVFSAK